MWLLAVADAVPSGVRTVTAAGLTAVVEVDEMSIATTELLLRHAAVVSSLLEQSDAVLPVRAGTSVSGEDEVRRLLHERQAELRLGLDRVRGGVELAVRCESGDGVQDELVTGGRDYLASRVRAWRWADDTVRQVKALGALPDVWDVAVLTRTPRSVKASLLVRGAAAERVKDQVARAGGPAPGSLRCTGPFAPYTFCSTPAGATR